jgi:hypothetical protein
MAYASRFQQQLRGPSPAAVPVSRQGGMNFGMDGLHTRRKEEGKGANKQSHHVSPDIKTPADVAGSSSHSSPTPSSKNRFSSLSAVRRSAVSGRQSINAGDLSIFSSKLRALMVVREQIEQLAQRHKQEESRLAQFMKQLLRGNPSPSDEPTASREQLVAAIADRDKAIATLDQFRTEINEVMSRMHKSLLSSHAQHEQDINKIELLTNENNRLRAIVFDVYGSRDDDELENSTALDNAERTIEKLNELLQEADAVLVNLRANNEELLRQNHDLRQRDRKHHEKAFAADDAASAAVVASSPTCFGSESLEEAASSTEIGRTTAQSTAMIESLRAELRKEKRHRLEAEEVSHQIMVEHTKNVRLLEQRLHHRGTPKETPRRSSFRIGSPTTTDRTQTFEQQPNPVREVDLLFEAKEISADEIGEPGALTSKRLPTHSRAGSDWSFSGLMPSQPVDDQTRDSRGSPSDKSLVTSEQFLADSQTRELQLIERELLRVAESLERE